nr:RNA-directed DNA polymerase, eukaryota [Tanacetum cinerariifolium]
LKQGDPLSPFLFILVMESLHLSFKRVQDVDDAIFMGQWSKRNIDTLMYMLRCFEWASGLSINLSKSKLMGLAVSIEKVEEVTRHIGCGFLNTSFSFLGSKVGGYMSQIKSWDEVIDKMVKRISKWKMKTLSIGGRLTLLKAVFGSIPIYHMSIFKVPMLVLQRMESIWCHFLRVIHAIHGVDGRIGRAGNVGYTSVCCDIIKEIDWMPRSGIEFEQWDHLLDSLEGVMLNPSEDRWSWDLNGSGEFSVASARRYIDNNRLPDISSKTRWIKEVHIKVNVYAWKVRINGLPTRWNILRRGIDIPSILCPQCETSVESSKHLFFNCSVVRAIFWRVCIWWDVSYMATDSFDEWISWITNLRLPSKHKSILEGVCYGLWWFI